MKIEIQKQNAGNKLFLLMAMSTAILLVTPVLVLAALGFFLDYLFHTTPLITILGVCIGFISGMTNVFKLLRLSEKIKKTKSKE